MPGSGRALGTGEPLERVAEAVSVEDRILRPRVFLDT